MKNEELTAVKELKERNLSLIAFNGSNRYESDETGIKPILMGLEKDALFFKDMEVYDKIIGKAAAMLFIYGKVKSVFGIVMSRSAQKMLESHGIEYGYETLVDSIINRKGTDICPMEKVVMDIDDIDEAYIQLKERSKELNS